MLLLASSTGPGYTGGLQQPSSHSPIRTKARKVLPLPDIIGIRRDGAAAVDRSSPRPTSRPRQSTSSPPSVGRGRQMTTPAWVQARVIGGFQLQAASGAQQERDRAPAIDERRLAEVSPPVERTRRTTSPVRVSVGIRVLPAAPGGFQQPTLRWPMPTGDRNVLPLLHTIEVRRGRAASDDRPSPRPSLRSRYRPLTPTAGDLATAPPPVGLGRQTTTPAWVQSRTIGGLQLQTSSRTQ